MHTTKTLSTQLHELGITATDTVLVHSSLKSIGEVTGGPESIFDALTQHLSDGLLVFPTHTWKQIPEEKTLYDPETEPSCVGALSDLFRNRPGAQRSLHPTHSVAAIGRDAESFISGEEFSETPCPRSGCWGKLIDYQAKLLFIGCSMRPNTTIHMLEEVMDIPDRLTDEYTSMQILLPGGKTMERPMRRHHSSGGDVSQNYSKMREPLLERGIAVQGFFGDAETYAVRVPEMAELICRLLEIDPQLFLDDRPVPQFS
ncbi:AAC(3) family N-acetyltransferase [Spirochaeta dissipatitropha]